MGRTLIQTVTGFLWLALDSVFQRLINWGAGRGCPLFDSASKSLIGKTAVVTGANTGLGFESARWLAANGATVVLACRNLDKGEAALSAIRSQVKNASLRLEKLDLSDFSSVRACATRLNQIAIHMLILNAGVMGVKRTNINLPEPHMTVNHAAHSLLLLLLAPTLRAHQGRIVSVSSYASLVSDIKRDDIHLRVKPTGWFTAYANSKLAQLLFARALAKRAPNLPVLCIHPGESTTDVARYVGSIFVWLHHHVVGPMLLTPREAARTIVFAAATSDTSVIEKASGGVMMHAVQRTITLPSRLLNDVDADWMWTTTLDLIEMSEQEALKLLRPDENQ